MFVWSLQYLMFGFCRWRCRDGTHKLGFIERLLPNADFFLNLLLIFARFVLFHAFGVVASKQPGDLLATAGGERMREDLDIELVPREHALEKVT